MERFDEIRKLWEIWDNSFGFSEQELIKCENRLERRLPETLRQYYLQIGNHEDINETQDCLQYPSYLQINKDGLVVFYKEHFGTWQAGVKIADFEQENPKVLFSYNQKIWESGIGRLKDFLLFQACSNSLFSLPFNAHSYEVSIEKEIFIRERWKRMNIPQILTGKEFFQKFPDEVLAIMKNDNKISLFIAANSEERFRKIFREINLDWWDYISLVDE